MKNNNLSIANILAVVGLAGIGIVSFFGMFLHSSDGTPGGAIIGALALTIGLALLLWASIKAKGAEDNPDKWRYVEWASVAIYVVVALLFATPFNRFFQVMGERDDLQKKAKLETKAIRDLYANYNYQQEKLLTNAAEQFQNYIDSKQSATADPELAKYVNERGVTPVDGWKRKSSLAVKLDKDLELDELESDIETWNIMTLPQLATRLEAKEKAAWENLEKKILNYGDKNQLIPVINGGGSRPYSFGGLASFDLGEKPEPAFANTLRSINGGSILGWIIYVVLNLLVLLNYAVARRSQFVGIKGNQFTGGASLE